MPNMIIRGIVVVDKLGADEAALGMLQAAGFIIVKTEPNRKFEVHLFPNCPEAP